MKVLEKRFTRRDFLKGTGAMVVAFCVPRFLTPANASAAQSSAIGPAQVDPNLMSAHQNIDSRFNSGYSCAQPPGVRHSMIVRDAYRIRKARAS
jgi:hypothetical protein